MTEHAPPSAARLLLRLVPLGTRRDEIEADLNELFGARAARRGARYARRRYVGDVLSLCWHHRRSPRARESAPSNQSRRFPVAEVVQDLAYATRLLRRSPGAVLIPVVGLGVAIGVATSIFSILNMIAFRSTGIRNTSGLVTVMKAHQGGLGNGWSHADYLHMRESARSVDVEAFLRDGASFATKPGGEAGQSAGLLLVSGSYLAMLNARASLGRILTAADDAPGAPAVVVVNHAFWSSRLGADPAIVGQSLWLNARPFVVVGVAERGFAGTADTPPAMWTTLANYHVLHGGSPLDRRSSTTVNLVTRLADVPAAQAEAELSSIVRVADPGRADVDRPTGRDSGTAGREYARALVNAPAGVRLLPFALRPGKNAGQIAMIVTVVLTAIGLVLILACANVTTLLLANAAARRAEIAVRIAVGAGRARIARQLLTESLSLGVMAGALGLLFTIWLAPILANMVDVPDTFEIGPDGRVYGFLCVVSVLAGLGAGLAPSAGALRDVRVANRGADSRPARRGSVLVGVQAASSMVLLVLAALLARGAAQASRLDIGFEASGLITIDAAFERGAHDEAGALAYWNFALERVRALPHVQAAALADVAPFSGSSRVTMLDLPGGRYTIRQYGTRAEYFETLGLRLLAGRTYTDAEVQARAPVGVISEALARDFFPGANAIGQSLGRIVEGSHSTIIGIVSNSITARLRDPGAGAIYEPMRDPATAKMIVRIGGVQDATLRSLQALFHSLDSRVRVDIRHVRDGLERQLEEPRALSRLASLLAAVALALALVGLYGVTAFVTGQRRQEIGVRIALGATARDVVRLLMRDSLRPVSFGLAGGVLGAGLGSRVMAGALYGISPADPFAFGGALIVLVTAATLAVFVPTRRAAAVDPASVLRDS